MNPDDEDADDARDTRTLCIHVFDDDEDTPNRRARETCSTMPQDEVVAEVAVTLNADPARVHSPKARVSSRTARVARIAVVAIVAVAARSNCRALKCCFFDSRHLV